MLCINFHICSAILKHQKLIFVKKNDKSQFTFCDTLFYDCFLVQWRTNHPPPSPNEEEKIRGHKNKIPRGGVVFKFGPSHSPTRNFDYYAILCSLQIYKKLCRCYNMWKWIHNTKDWRCELWKFVRVGDCNQIFKSEAFLQLESVR